jgi:hypothetical protein
VTAHFIAPLAKPSPSPAEFMTIQYHKSETVEGASLMPFSICGAGKHFAGFIWRRSRSSHVPKFLCFDRLRSDRDQRGA